MRARRLTAVLLAISFSLVVAAGAAAQAAKRPLSYDAYDSWKSIRGTTLSDDGAWLAYALVAQEDDGDLVVRNMRTGAEFRHARGESPVITADGRFVVFTILPPQADVDKAKKEKKKPDEMPKNSLGIMSLADGSVQTVDRVKSFAVPELGASRVAYLKEKAATAVKTEDERPKTEEKTEDKKEKKKDPGTDLVIRDLATGAETTVAEAVEYEWNRQGSWLAYGVSSTVATNDGAFARGTSDGSTVTLHKGQGHYKGFAFDEAGRQLAFVSDQAEYASEVSPYRLYHWTPGASSASELVAASTAGMPGGYAVSEHGALQFSKDGARLFVGTAPAPEPPPADDASAPIKVDLWHWKDPMLQPMQAVRADDMRERSYRAVVHLKDTRFVQLALPDMPQMAVGDDPSHLLGESDVPYQQLISWDGGYDDIFVVNVTTGERTQVLERSYYGASLSPDGKYVLYFDEATGDWWSFRIRDGRRANLTEKVDPAVIWVDEKHDTPNQPRPYGVAGWTAADALVLVYDRYDIWALDPDGGAAPRNATAGLGRAEQLVFRYQRLDPDERVIPSTAVLLSAINDVTKAGGFYRATVAAAATPARLMMIDKAVRAPIKAKKADVVVFTQQRFEEFPNLWVSDLSFADPRKISDANPQQAQYIWGRSELIDYVNNDGKPLRAILTKPENFDPSKKYPLMVYIYEELTQNLHGYVAPAPSHRINIARYVSNGYIVLQPDIVYETGYPGEAAEKCVIPAVQKVLAMGFVDSERVGIQGHSWGGYQITHLITRTDIFRAVQGGAPVANMVSAYGGIRWGTGMSRAFQYEKTQSRIGAPPWDAALQYIENSPIFWVEKVNTPYLTIHNDEDDAVPWYQGIEFFNALRRLGKEAYLFNYNTEKHGLRQRVNQKHYTVHLDEYFDHFLKGAPRPAWMEGGVPYLERGTRDVSDLFKAKVPTEPTPDGQAQTPGPIESLRALGLDAADVGHVRVLYVPADREHALRLAALCEDAVSYFSRELGTSFAPSLAVLRPEHWFVPYAGSEGEPYGIPWGWIPDLLIAVPASLDEGVLITGSDRSADLRRVRFVLLHEFGHLASKQILHPSSDRPYSSVRWFEELLATYFAYAFVRANDTDWARMAEEEWDQAVKSFTPAVVSLDWSHFRDLPPPEFARTYAWYQNLLNLRAARLYEEHGLDFLHRVRDRLDWQDAANWTTDRLMPILDGLAPGFQAWASALERRESAEHRR